MEKRSKALPLTITLGSILLVICLFLAILWNFILIYNYSKLKHGETINYSGYLQWIIFATGCFFLLTIIAGVVLFIVFLAKQIILNQMQKNFIDNVTHELKTPLTSIKLHIETLKKHDLPKEKKDNFLDIMLNDVERLDILLNHVLESAKLEHFHHYDIKEIELEKIINSSIEIVSNRYSLKRENFETMLENIIIKSDPSALQLVFINILDNAVKYSGDNIKIIIETFMTPDGKTDILIKDNGAGIPGTEINKIFRRFYRIPDENTRKRKGSGLGLYIVKETIRNLKGQIYVTSDGINKGTTFKITLPGNK